ncbi:MAG TPA: helix-turn-helix domain-containing protein [Cyclobacteriaceae bacterium]|nr:helix-turn-helix domain-containing protein [Cyclobacteriaceae bacterium]HRF32978.1 helix-turn-helix domain-containing protein [Cyclobacteriaceae bacterium]
MVSGFITTEDLQEFKLQLLEEIQKIVNAKHPTPVRKWLKSHEVRRLLTISPSKLQSLRDTGTLPFTKIGAVIYYSYDDIENMLQTRSKVGESSAKSINR